MPNPLDPGFYHTAELRSFGFKSVGENVSVSRDCTIIGIENISIGDNSRIDTKAALFGNDAGITIGAHVHISAGCHLAGRGGIVLKDFSGLSQGVRIFSASDDFSGKALTGPTVPSRLTNPRVAEVRLGRHCLIGAGSVILPGCVLGDGVAVGALTVVRHNLDAWGIYAGSPVRRIRSRERRLLLLEASLIN